VCMCACVCVCVSVSTSDSFNQVSRNLRVNVNYAAADDTGNSVLPYSIQPVMIKWWTRELVRWE
jgi:hypothetical protein